jgi:predicted nucleic acid-binding protein
VVNAYFLDSSALVKRYVAETGTAWVQALSLTFVAADDRLITIAQAEGLQTDNSNHHP